MKRLGYRASWPTQCFIDGGCGRKDLWAHTNGNGDFVLLDRLEPPWPIHECYVHRVPLVLGFARDITASRHIDWDPSLSRQVPLVQEIKPEELGRRSVSIVGSVLQIEKGILGKLRQSRHSSAGTDKEIREKLGGYNAYARFVTGEQQEYWAFINARDCRVRETDTVAARLKVTTVLGTPIFKATDIVVFTADDVRD